MKFDIQTIQPIVTLIKDIITGTTALIAAIVAIVGLRTWKKQLKGKTEYELAQKFLRTIYVVRDAFASVRYLFQSTAEIYQAMREANIEGDPIRDQQMRNRSEAAVFQKRWKKLQDAFVDSEAVLLEAETLWGEDIKELFIPLQRHASTLHTTIQTYIADLERPPRYNADDDGRRMSIMYAITDGSRADPFAEEIAEAIKKIEDFLRPRLKLG